MSVSLLAIIALQACHQETGCAKSVNANTLSEFAVPDAPWPQAYDVPALRDWEQVTQLGEDTVQRLKLQAYAGDPKSAVILAEFSRRSDSRSSEEEARWRRIAAESGDVPSMIDIAWAEQLAGGEERCLRAKFWLERAAIGQSKLPVSSELRNPSPAEEVGLYGLRDNWTKCLEGNAAAYLGVARPDSASKK
jgi:hypothetical protein